MPQGTPTSPGNSWEASFSRTRPLQSDGGLFLIKLNSSGDVVFATPVGTHRYMDQFGGMAVERDGTVWIAGSTRSPDLAVTPGGSPIRDMDVGDAFVIADASLR